ncbi:prohibitin family protein [bacterium]|nr:prohibitin family protein [bacterium]
MQTYRPTLGPGHFLKIFIGITILLLVLRCFVIIPAGHVGVVDFFGKVSDQTLKPGVNFRNPLANIHKFSVKTQEAKEVMVVPSKEGLSVQLEISVLFHLNPEMAADVYKTVGPNYRQIILEPNFRSVTRGVTAGYEARALYTSEREILAQQIQSLLAASVQPRGLTIEATPLRQISLPSNLMASIEQKLQSEQESQRMEFILTKETQEADRKRIEAQGIADFQKIVSQGLSDAFLRWKGIEATEKLATSTNAKVVVVGSGKDGLPIILGNQ